MSTVISTKAGKKHVTLNRKSVRVNPRTSVTLASRKKKLPPTAPGEVEPDADADAGAGAFADQLEQSAKPETSSCAITSSSNEVISDLQENDTAAPADEERAGSPATLDLTKYEPPAPQSKPAGSLLERLNLKLRPETLARLAELRAMATEAQPARPARGNWAPLYPVYARLRANGYSRDDALDWMVQQGAIAAEHKTKALNALKTLAVRRGKPAP